MADDERKRLTYEEAVSMLPDGKEIHTFRNTSGMLIGAHWSVNSILDAIGKYGSELSGPMATNMHHGIVLFDDAGALFIETM
jgi:hypothetical protein